MEELKVSPTEFEFFNIVNKQRLAKTPLELSMKLMAEATNDFSIIPKSQKPILVSGSSRSEFKGYLEPMELGSAAEIVFLACQESSFYQKIIDKNAREIGVSIKKFKSGRIFFSVIVMGTMHIAPQPLLDDFVTPKYKQNSASKSGNKTQTANRPPINKQDVVYDPERTIYTPGNTPKLRTLPVIINSPRTGQFKKIIYEATIHALKFEGRKYYPQYSEKYSDYAQAFLNTNPACRNITIFTNYMRSKVGQIEAMFEGLIDLAETNYIDPIFLRHFIRSGKVMQFIDRNPYNFLAVATADTKSNVIFAWIAIGYDPSLPVLDIYTLKPAPGIKMPRSTSNEQEKSTNFATPKTYIEAEKWKNSSIFRPYIPSQQKTEPEASNIAVSSKSPKAKAGPTVSAIAAAEVRTIIEKITSHFSICDIAAKTVNHVVDDVLFNIAPNAIGLVARVNTLRAEKGLPSVQLDEGGMLEAAQFYADSWAAFEPEDLGELQFAAEDLGELGERQPVCVRIATSGLNVQGYLSALEAGGALGEFATISVAFALESEINPVCVVLFAK